MNEVPIVYQTGRFVAVDKPAGFLSVPGKGEANQDCVAARVRAMFPGATGPLTVHRLDMDTSGLLVLGLDEDAQRTLSMQFEARTVEKKYVALLGGDVPVRVGAREGEIRVPIRPDITRRPIQIVDDVHGRVAITRWRVIEVRKGVTRVEFLPITGRSHQLRLHAAHVRGLGTPILGDPLYGDPAAAPRLMLHASFLAIDDPHTGNRVVVQSPPPF